MSAPHVLQPTIEQNLHAIASLLDRAFAPSNYESRLVALLVRNHRQIHHWTLQSRDRILAYACYSRAYHGNQMIGYHLGATLSDAALQSQAIFVLGHPAYYPLVGFRRIEQPVCPFDEGNQHFMALRYCDPTPFTIGYEPEFTR